MKKLLTALLLSAAILVTGCSKSEQPAPDSVPAQETTEPTAEFPDLSSLTSQEIVSSMTIGWNLGNTLDSCQADRDGDGVINEHVADGEEPDETLWGNPPRDKRTVSGAP